MDSSLGLIAGNGILPHLIAREAKRCGRRVVVCAVQGETDPSISSSVENTTWIRLGQLGRLLKFFKEEGVREAIMAGKITKTNLFRGEVRPDLEMVKALARTRDHADDSLLGAIADHLDRQGIKILNSTSFLDSDSLPLAGCLTRRKPTKEDTDDIEFGWNLAKEIGRLDIGQTVVVKNKAVLAVEAVEGTDEAILRGGDLGAGGVTVVKVAKPNQDMRFDVPTIGLKTLNALIQVKARTLAFEAERTILLDRSEFIERADRHKIAIVARGQSK